MSEEQKLAGCPFCGGAARIESNRDWHRLYAAHDEDCVFDADDHALMYPAQPGYLLEIAEVWNRRAASTRTASDTRTAAGEAVEPCDLIVAKVRVVNGAVGFQDARLSILEKLDGKPLYAKARDIPGIWGASKDIAGEAECDAAMLAAPAGQQDAIAAARARLEAKWDADGDCGSCGWHAALYEHNVEDWEIEHALEKNGGVLELSCVSKDDDRASSHRGVKINIAPPPEQSAASGSREGRDASHKYEFRSGDGKWWPLYVRDDAELKEWADDHDGFEVRATATNTNQPEGAGESQ